ncbi:E3 ubiquitin-protein ligase RNF168 isoform X1 [Microcaecilia unicolor]|uniref:RING-type E3 ubiquitin transferase n=1 Tax=Microcaecilia unicolor TaxID=1415580 RepID=A0A6P7Z9Q2_9AMPH|nr:E3 ubiquitin-protein ligase RNF168 isoform X1 [Microcaecilia unicolor]
MPTSCKWTGFWDLQKASTVYPVPHLSKPGELREEYEAEVNKLRAERQAQEEEQRRASEEYILKLLAEEAEEQKKVEEQQRDLKEQLRRDEELARLLCTDLNVHNEVSELSTPRRLPLLSRKAATSASKSCKSTKNKQSHPGGIQRYLFPVVQSSTSSFQLSGNEKEGTETLAPMERSFMQPTSLMWTEEEDEMPTLSPQMPSHIPAPAPSLEESFHDRPMPQLNDCSEITLFLEEQDGWMLSNSLKPRIDNKLCLAEKKGLGSFPGTTGKMGNNFSQVNCHQQVYYSETHIFPWGVPNSADDSKKKDCIRHNVEGVTRNSTGGSDGVKTFDGSATNEAPKRKCEGQCVKESSSSCSASKRRRDCMGVAEEEEERTGAIVGTNLQVQQLITVECDLNERQRQVEQDRLIALKLQKEMNKEMNQVSRGKGAPDEYCLRAKPSSSRVAQPEEESIPKRATQELKRNQKALFSQSLDENSQPPRTSSQKSPLDIKRGKKTRNCISNNFYSARRDKALQASNKQQTILDMLQKKSATH